MQKQLVPFVVAVLSVTAAAVRVEAHAFLVRAEPRVGSKLDKAPTQVRIWFTESVDPVSSSIKVFDGQGKQVDKKDTHSDPGNRALLRISLKPALAPGEYRVIWRVASVDTHVTSGDFRFQIVQ
jgi:copper resistance protein C